MSRGVHLVTTGFVPRDAISHHVMEEQRAIRAIGIRCEIFADPNLTHPSLTRRAHPVEHWNRVARPGDAAVLHYSIASSAMDHVLDRADRCALTYHNITPAGLLWEFAPHVALECARGRRRLAELADRVHSAAAVSEYNALELRELGFPEPHVLGLMRPTLPIGAPPPTDAQRPPRLLFVGRGVPNKAQHHLILALGALRQTGVEAELLLVGAWSGTEAYQAYCGALAAATGVADRVKVRRLNRRYGAGQRVCDERRLRLPLRS